VKIAFVGHSYHFATRSNSYLLDLLRELGEVEIFPDTSWQDDRLPDWLPLFSPAEYDCLVVYQSLFLFHQLAEPHPNVLFVPMYDGMVHDGVFHWHERYGEAKTLCLSLALYREVRRRTEHAFYAQYYPQPPDEEPEPNRDPLDAFFWYRAPPITHSLVADLTRGTTLGRLTLHDAPDPNARHPTRRGRLPRAREIHESRWFADCGDYLDLLARHSLFFASRLREGIGLSFLEAMGRGLCVVAPATPAHDEYISDGTNGLLYRPDAPEPLDLDSTARLGARARASAIDGWQRWLRGRQRLLDFIAAPTASIGRRPAVLDFWRATQRADRSRRATAAESWPRVSVITVCRNAAAELERTIASVTEQTHPNLEYLVIDGASTDGTVELIERHGAAIDFWQSRPDSGVYPAMAEALVHASGEYVIFMNAGDRFVGPESLEALFARAPQSADVLYGDHVYESSDGDDELKRVRDFEHTWRDLKRGRIGPRWLEGMPCHQTVAIRASLLRRFGFDPAFRIAADHELYFRLRRAGCLFYNCGELVAIYRGEGLSARHFDRCVEEWLALAVRHGPEAPARRFYGSAFQLAPTDVRRVIWRARLDRWLGRSRAEYPSPSAESTSVG